MGQQACRYVIIKFVPDVVRDEPLNIGVVLQCPDKQWVECRFATTFARVVKLYPDVDVNLLRSFADDMESRISGFMQGRQLALGEVPADEAVPLSSPDFLDFLFMEYGGRFQFTQPQPTLAEDLEAELLSLFSTFVVPQAQPQRPEVRAAPVTHPTVVRRVRRIFQEERVMPYLHPRVTVPGKHWEYRFDFAYQNAHRGLIQSVAFDVKGPEDKQKRAFVVAGRITDILERGEFDKFSLILQPPSADKVEGYEEAKVYLADVRATTVIPMEEARRYAISLRGTFEPPRLFQSP